MRVAVLTDTYPPEVNGVSTVVSLMVRGVAARGHQVLVICPDAPGADAVPAGHGIQVIRRPSLACPGYNALRLTWPWDGQVSEALRQFAPDVMHLVTEGPLGGQGRRHALAHQVPFVTSFHTDFPAYAQRYLGPWAVKPTTAYLTRFHGPAAATQTPSHDTAGRLRTMGLSQAMVWGRSVDAQFFHPGLRTTRTRQELGVSNRLLVLHVGRLAVEKDMATLVEVFRCAKGLMGEAADFCIAGDGPEARRVRQALPFARHFGFLDRTRLATLYAAADLFVFPSPTETCGLVALEAMASGLPVVGANAGGIPESVRPQVTGMLVAPGDVDGFVGAVLLLLRDPALRADMSAAARQLALTRDWAVELDEQVALYARIAASAAPATRQGATASPSRVPIPIAR